MYATHLQTEYLTEPLGLGIAAPRFYWHCADGVRQTAYQIIARCSNAVVWDSGKVASAEMTQIRYEGKPLKSRDCVRWTVQLWDETDTPGKTAESRFELGLLDPQDWRAQWMSGDYTPKKKQRYPVDCFRKSFETAHTVASARLYATACGIYDVTLNGKRLADFVLAPGVTDYRKRLQYQVYDVTPLLQSSNVLELRLADGWYRGSIAAYGVENVFGTQTGVLAQLEIIGIDGSTDTIVTDSSWAWSNDGAIRFADLKDGEIYDAAKTPAYAGRARVIQPMKAARLVASDNVPVREKERFSPRLLTAKDGARVLDFGQNIAGYLAFTVQGKPGQRLRLICGEVLDADGHVNLSGVQETRPVKGWSNFSLIAKLLGKPPSGLVQA
ncbi:MAG: family 78 glycoside hydrolase catalytic domain, partial [Ruthenibacterium sp.]